MDIARSMARLQIQKYGRVGVTLTCLESEEIMPASREEIDEAREEGILIIPARGPERIEIENDEIKGLHTIACVSVFDESGKFGPKFDKDDQSFIKAETVIEAIGQAADTSFIPKEVADKLEYDGRRIKVDARFQSSIPWLFFGGDMVRGPDVIHAIYNGHEAAEGMEAFITGRS